MEQVIITQIHTGQQLKDYGDHIHYGTIEYYWRPNDETPWQIPPSGQHEDDVWRLVDLITGSRVDAEWPNTKRGMIAPVEGRPNVWTYHCTSDFVD